MFATNVIWLLAASIATAQQIQPSNDTADIADSRTSPRFWINSTQGNSFPGFLVAPLAQYSQISRNVFLSISFQGVLVETDASNANQVQSDDFNYVSCDPEDYERGSLDVNSILSIITSQQSSNARDKSSLIFYSTRSNHCNATNITGLDLINGIFTTLDPVVAAEVASRNFTEQSRTIAILTPDRTSYSPQSGGGGGYSQPPTTAIAMIILYSITGIITALFIVIIITGAIRAHRHPERYGPRSLPGRTRQSRAKGIARAMLETLPIVKFGDHHDLPKDATKNDVEMAHTKPAEVAGSKSTNDKNVATTTTTIGATAAATNSETNEDIKGASNADGSDDTGSLGCSICTEDFQKGEELRVLPCNHKFHPDCVDPWLLNVSGTCPLCRISLAPGEEGQTENENMPPPLESASPFPDRRSQAIHNLMAIAYGSREERVAALRRYRAERRNRTINDDERLSRARRFREVFRIRTRRHEPNATEAELRNTGIDAIAAPHTRM